MSERELKGDHCQCVSCLEYFNSTYAFDKHRVGAYTPAGRRCLTIEEMLAKGMAKNAADYWISAKMPNPSLAQRRISGDPVQAVGEQG